MEERIKKPRVVFAYAEAGLGHTTPMNSIAGKFEQLYGDRVECVRSQFFTEGGDKKLIKYEEKLKEAVVISNRSTAYGFFLTINMELWRTRISSWASMKCLVPGAAKRAVKHMDELAPDLVVTTHWAPNYYAKKCKSRPLTAMYCPDIKINPMFSYPCDLAMVSNSVGYNAALKKHPFRFNKNNLKQVDFLIREEAFSTPADKMAMRKRLGLDAEKFTVLLMEGGYGIGKMEEICKIILERDLPVTLIPVCGRNEELYNKFKGLKSKGNCSFYPQKMVNNIFEFMVASDLFCGKSGANSMAEPCFFGVPQIITKYATTIERAIGKYYIDNVGSAMKIFSPVKAADKIEDILKNPDILKPYAEAAKNHRENYGAEKAAAYIFDLLLTRFPYLKNGDN